MKLLHDLRRRRMFRLAGLYIVGAWIVIQVADVSFPAWGVPESAMRYLFIAASLCFPVAMVFGWMYDVTSDGIVRTRDAVPGETVDLSLKRKDFLTLAALLAVGVTVLLGSAERIYREIEQLPAIIERFENSVAVLPFTNLDMNAETGYFSDGVTEEILHRLSSLRALHVLGRTSSFAFRNSEDGPARIAEILGVRYLLQGSVRRDDDYVRITANLLDESGYAVWTQTFDRKLEGIFTIQSEIASTVSSEVLHEIVPLADLPAGRTTENMEAYEEYLIGRAFFNARTPGWQEQAQTAFGRAIELDDQFAPPYAGLAMALYVSQKGRYVGAAKSAAEKSLELDPDLAGGHAILGLILGGSEGDATAGTQALRRALEIDPSFAIAHSWLASSFYAQDLIAEGDAAMDRGLEIDPLNPTLSVNIASRESRNGNFERAERLLLRLTQLPEPSGLATWGLTQLYTDWGRHDQAVRWAKEVARGYANTTNAIGFGALAFCYQRLGMTAAADHWLGVLLERMPAGPGHFVYPSYLSRQRGDYEHLQRMINALDAETRAILTSRPAFPTAAYAAANIVVGNFEVGIELFESQFDATLSNLEQYVTRSDAIQMLHALAYAYDRVGESKKSRELLMDLARVVDAEDSEPLVRPIRAQNRATNRLMLGDTRGALQALTEAVELGWTNYFWIDGDPVWDEPLQSPGFQDLVIEVKTELDRQRAVVEAADQRHDFRAEIEQLFTQ